MKTKLKYIIIASLLFGASGFNSVKAITADELLATIVVPVYQFVIDTFTVVGQVLVDHETRIGDSEARTTALETADFGSQITGLESRIATLESEPKANIAVVAPTAFDDINAGFTEGSVWVDMTDKDAYILVDSAPGVAVWEAITNDTLYSIGDVGPAGGIVFYVTNGGLHGLEAAPADLTNAQWDCPGILITGADGTAIGTGAPNTADILAGCAEPDGAAALADAYTLNGFSDWFLPSQDELNLMFLNIGQGSTALGNVGGFVDDIYWSSSEFNSSNAWYQDFTCGFRCGSQDLLGKLSMIGVRPIRAF